MKAEGSLSRDAGVLRGSRDGAGTPWVREGAWALRAPLGNTQPWPRGSSGLPRLLPPGLVLLTRAQLHRR